MDSEAWEGFCIGDVRAGDGRKAFAVDRTLNRKVFSIFVASIVEVTENR